MKDLDISELFSPGFSVKDFQLLPSPLRQPASFLIFILVSLLLSSCYEDQEGCLDINATNFDVEADISCLDCCEFPVLQLDFQHKAIIGDTTINLVYDEFIYEDQVGNLFGIKNLQFYLSDFHLIRNGGDTTQVSDTLQITKSNGEVISIKDNFLLVNPGVFGFSTLGDFRSEGNYDGIGFNFGLNPVANQLDTTYFTDEHPLGPQAENMFTGNGEGYLFAKIELLPEPGNDSLFTEILIKGDENLVPIENVVSYTILEGVDPRLIVLIDYYSWFSTIDIQNDSPEVMGQKIVTQLANSFNLVEIQYR